jgi:CRISPR system Cascade subunit CasC
MNRFIQLHFLTSYPPANLNRDDQGRPKTAKMGGFDRLRVSSQSHKRAWRTSDIFEDTIDKGTRTRLIGAYALEKLSKFSVLTLTQREEIARNIAKAFGKLKSDSVELETPAFISKSERSRIDDVINRYRNGFEGATEESNSLGVGLFSVLSSDIHSSITYLIDVMKDGKNMAMLKSDWSGELKKHIKKYTTAEDKGYDFLGRMVDKQSEWLDSMAGDTEVGDDQLELLFAENYTNQTKKILKKLDLGALMPGKNAKETAHGEIKNKSNIKLCKGWEVQIEAWVDEVKNSEDNDFTSEENIQKLKQAISPFAIPKESILTNEHTDSDIALFGRMLADSPKYNMEAACQVAHAISVHPVAIEDDYFSAVEELNQYQKHLGAAHTNETGFAAGLFYSYICINQEQLIRNLINDFSEDTNIYDHKYDTKRKLAAKTIRALIEAAVKVPPTGKQNSFGTRAYASYVLAEKGDQQPRSLSVAFLKPITGNDYGSEAISALTKHLDNIDTAFGKCADERFFVNALDGKGGNYLTSYEVENQKPATDLESQGSVIKEADKIPLFVQLLDFLAT